MALNANYNTYEVTFSENKKYRPATRTVVIHGLNEYHARMLCVQEFGSFKTLVRPPEPSNKIKILSVVEIKDESEVEESNIEEKELLTV